MAISRRLRFEILRRDNYTCRYCGASSPDATLTVDHVVAITLGGGDEPNNLVTACNDCNAGKSSIAIDSSTVEDVDAAALLFARAVGSAAELRRADTEYIERVWLWFENLWWRPKPFDWRASIERFISEGLTARDLEHFMDISQDANGVSDRFNYFCKCCWNEIGRRQELARRLIEDGEVQ